MREMPSLGGGVFPQLPFVTLQVIHLQEGTPGRCTAEADQTATETIFVQSLPIAVSPALTEWQI